MPSHRPEYVDPLEDYYALIGKITILLSRIEFEIECTLEDLFQIKAMSGEQFEDWEEILKKKPLRGKFEKWQEILIEHDPKVSETVSATFDKAIEILDERNKLVHAAMAKLSFTGEMVFLERKRNKTIDRNKEVSVSLEDLNSLIKSIEELEIEVGACCMHYQVECDNLQEALGYEHDQMF